MGVALKYRLYISLCIAIILFLCGFGSSEEPYEVRIEDKTPPHSSSVIVGAGKSIDMRVIIPNVTDPPVAGSSMYLIFDPTIISNVTCNFTLYSFNNSVEIAPGKYLFEGYDASGGYTGDVIIAIFNLTTNASAPEGSSTDLILTRAMLGAAIGAPVWGPGWMELKTTVQIATLTIHDDLDEPYTAGWNPSKNATKAHTSDNVTLHVMDDGDGVNISSIRLTIKGKDVTDACEIYGDPADYLVFYDPPDDFSNGEMVNVLVKASDIADTPNTMGPESYNFTVEEGPNIPPNATDLMCEGLINPSGVNNSRPSFCWTFVDDDPNHPGQSQSAYQILISSSLDNLKADLGDLWDSGKVVNATNYAIFAGWPTESEMPIQTKLIQNKGTTYWWKVRVWDDYKVPTSGPYSDPQSFMMSNCIFIDGCNPAENGVDVPLFANISANFSQDGPPGVNRSSIRLMIKGKDVTDSCDISGDPREYRILYDPPEDFSYGQVISVALDALDLADLPSRVHKTYNFTIEQGPNLPPEICDPRCEGLINPTGVANSHPIFTWNAANYDPNHPGQSQSAYQILVASSYENLLADVGDMWDSGKVVRNSKSVIYHGSELTLGKGMTYWWKARIWDDYVQPAVGAYCDPQNFITKNNLYSRGWDPSKNAEMVPAFATIEVHVTEDGLPGVNKSSIRLAVEGLDVTPACVITGDSNDYMIFYDPKNDFDYGESIDVTVNAYDLADIPSSLQETCRFTIENGPNLPPEVAESTCGGLSNPAGIASPRPIFDWNFVDDDPNHPAQSQSAYQILVASSIAMLDADIGDIWNSRKVHSNIERAIYGGPELVGEWGTIYWWKIRVWDDYYRPAPSSYSAPQSFMIRP
jgi:hypothetical protein